VDGALRSVVKKIDDGRDRSETTAALHHPSSNIRFLGNLCVAVTARPQCPKLQKNLNIRRGKKNCATYNYNEEAKQKKSESIVPKRQIDLFWGCLEGHRRSSKAGRFERE
jgi:hypothetical protein